MKLFLEYNLIILAILSVSFKPFDNSGVNFWLVGLSYVLMGTICRSVAAKTFDPKISYVLIFVRFYFSWD